MSLDGRLRKLEQTAAKATPNKAEIIRLERAWTELEIKLALAAIERGEEVPKYWAESLRDYNAAPPTPGWTPRESMCGGPAPNSLDPGRLEAALKARIARHGLPPEPITLMSILESDEYAQLCKESDRAKAEAKAKKQENVG
jgi:hypothetical protein